MTKFLPPANTMKLRSNITGFRQEDHNHILVYQSHNIGYAGGGGQQCKHVG
jgi:hypothetical protein